jgi:hypothetical protein
MEKINWIDHVKNEQMLYRGKEGRNILYTVRHEKANWFGHILHRYCCLNTFEGKIGGV